MSDPSVGKPEFEDIILYYFEGRAEIMRLSCSGLLINLSIADELFS